MDQRRALMAIGGIIILLLAIVFGVAYFSSKNAKKPQVRKPSPTPSAVGSLTVPVASSEPGSTPPATPSTQGAAGTRSYTGQGFVLHYPESWGVLKCNNSQNFEFDPTNPTEQLGVKCNFAVKPITVLVGTTRLSCTGDTIQLGSQTAIRTKVTKVSGDINYRWCVNGAGYSLDITHRVSSTGSRATSKEDFSTQIEQMISSLSFGGGS